jgi:predicted nucleic acid-binding protein
MLKRQRVSMQRAIQAVSLYRQIPLRLVEVELEDTLRIADSLAIYAYDAYLIRCALKYRTPLISLDRGLIDAAKASNVQVLEVPE